MISSSFTQKVNVTPPDLSSLQDSTGFPAEEFSRMQAIYQELDRWYSGVALTENQQVGEDTVETYPTQYNPIPDTVEKHVSMLFGHYIPEEAPIVKPVAIPLKKDEGSKEIAQELQDMLNTIFYENKGNAIILDNGYISQIYGGCIFKVLCEANETSDPMYTTAIRLSEIHPYYFACIPSGLDFWDLREVWVVRPISVLEAKEVYSIEYDASENKQDNDITWLVEHSTKEYFKTTIDGKIATRTIGSEKHVLNTVNKYGIVPFVYIPHKRVGGFYGTSVIAGTIGLIKEANLRLSDYGDAVSSDAHTTITVAGASDLRTEKAKEIAPRVRAIEIKVTGAGTAMGKETNPQVTQLSQTAHSSMGELVDKLLDLYSKTVSIPPVAYGTDEGSQRSAATLILRMWPLIAHAQMERAYWSVGLNRLCVIIVRMLSIMFPEKYSKFKGIKIKHEWAPYLPKDREDIINEATNRFTGGYSSLDKIFDILGDVDDYDEEQKKILELKEAILKLEEKYTPKPQMGMANGPTQKKIDSDKKANQETKKESK